MEHQSSQTFADQVAAIPGGEHLAACYACGTCVSKCLIQQKLEPEYNPRRLLRMVMAGMRDEAFANPTTWLCSACDLCFSACPQEIHISSVIGAVKQLAIEAGYESPLEVVSVDQTLCSGCAICVMACPYDAPRLVEKQHDGEMDRVAEVDGNKCLGCGICVAACPAGAISRQGVGNHDIEAQLDISAEGPRLLVFVCDWCLRADVDVALLEAYPDNVRVIHIPCSGRIDPQLALLALRSGVDGVLVCGCKPGECHYQRGSLIGACKIGVLENMFDQMQMDSGRVRLVQIGTEERGMVRKEIDDMLTRLAARKEAH